MASIYEMVDELKRNLTGINQQEVHIALFGQPGAGKSAIINKLIGTTVAKEGIGTDTTTTEEKYEWKGLILVDLPGYGTKRFPKEGYLERFKISSYDLFLCVFSGKFHEADSQFFRELKQIGKVCLFVRNKHDEIWQEGKEISELEQEIEDDVRKHTDNKTKVYFTSCRNKFGINTLSTAIMENLEPAKRERWARFAIAYSTEFLDQKYSACEKYIAVASALSAANALNPIPGADIAVDVGIIFSMFTSIRESYGLSNKRLDTLKPLLLKEALQLINNVIKFSTREGILILLKKYAAQETAKTLSKYIPIVGQLVAGSIGFAITMSVGTSFLNDCHALAKAILEIELKKQ